MQLATQYDWSSLTNNGIRNHFTVTVRNKFATLQETFEIHTPNHEYENFANAYIEAATECILGIYYLLFI